MTFRFLVGIPHVKNDLEKVQSIPGKQEDSNRMLENLNSKREASLLGTIKNTDMKHSSSKAWATINKLTGWKHTSPNSNSMNPNAVA